jgi:hypothetical protein
VNAIELDVPRANPRAPVVFVALRMDADTAVRRIVELALPPESARDLAERLLATLAGK